nr:THxN family PEP-CTERM protein [Ectothiorhodospira lacustris]
MKLSKEKVILAGLACSLAGAAQAAPITTWQVEVETAFVQSSVTPTGVTFVGPTELRWGDPATTAGDSGLIISNSPADTLVNTNGSPVPNVSITHRNNPIFAGSPSLLSVDIASTLTLTPFAPSGAGLPAQTITFSVNFFETPNEPSTCADGEPNNIGVNINGCADIFVINQNSINFAFTYPDIGGDTPDFARTYFISFLELTSGLNPLPNAACNAVSGVSAPCLGFRTPENQTTTFQFAALITTDPVQVEVPEPASIGLLSLGLGAIGLMMRRRKQAPA